LEFNVFFARLLERKNEICAVNMGVIFAGYLLIASADKSGYRKFIFTADIAPMIQNQGGCFDVNSSVSDH